MGHGGQSEMEYHVTGRLGEKKVGANANAPTRKTKSGDRSALAKTWLIFPTDGGGLAAANCSHASETAVFRRKTGLARLL